MNTTEQRQVAFYPVFHKIAKDSGKSSKELDISYERKKENILLDTKIGPVKLII